MPTTPGSANTRSCMNTKAVLRPYKWGPGSMSPRWAGSSRSTLSRVG
jgi:hypothetical protein